MGNRQAGDPDGEPFADDVEDPERVVAANGQQARSRPLDVQALLDRQLIAAESNGPAVQAGIEPDRVAVVGVADGVPQGPGPAVEVVQDRERAGHVAAFEQFQPWPERPAVQAGAAFHGSEQRGEPHIGVS